ncbi:MAG: hypothetical protein JO250_12960 [Armatimonadetes bacterium]|nr:hypothetical protein [Armatimonadota bacterium]
MAQNALSVVARIKPDEVAALEELLSTIGNDIAGNTLVPFPQIKSLHFACWLILNRDSRFPPLLVLESNHDGPTDAHLDELIRCAGPGLDAIYRKCEGYPMDGASDPNSLKQYLQRHSVQCPAFYVGCYGQSVASVRHAMALRQEIEGFLDREQDAGRLVGLSQVQIFQNIREFARTLQIDPPYTPTQAYDSILIRSKVNTALALLLAAALLLKFPRPVIVLLLLFTVALRWHEIRDVQGPSPTPPPIDPRLFGKEDIFTQNHLTTMVTVKPGGFRLGTLKGVLWLVNQLAKTVFIAGNLGGIPTIHFARWLLTDDGRRLLFFSNYDGSWASYLGDFVDKANYGLTAVWSNTDNFPPSQFLFWGGAQHIEEFKLWSRQHNEFAHVWYSAYPDATVSNITDAVQLRDGLSQNLAGPALARWFQRL